MTLTYELYLDIFPLDLHAKIQVRTQTHTHTHNAKTITTDTSEMWGVKIANRLKRENTRDDIH